MKDLHRSLNPASDLEELLAHNGTRFVECAYITLLGRDADAAGLRHYVVRLKNGRPKLRIVRDLALSDEGLDFGRRLPGVQKAITRYAMAQMPIVGFLFRSFLRIEGPGEIERLARSNMALLGDLNARLEELPETLLGMQIDRVVKESARQQPVPAPTGGAAVAGQGLEFELARLAPEVQEVFLRLRLAAIRNQENVDAAGH